MSCAYGKSGQSTPMTEADRGKLSLPKSYHFQDPLRPDDPDEFRLDAWQESDVESLFEIFSDVIDEGQSYPQESITLDEFRNYFLSHHCFVVRLHYGPDTALKVVAGFYIKPNFPGRSSHLANYGLLVDRHYRGRGLANFMVSECIRLARLLNYQALYTNLVFANNTASIKTCHRYGFQQVGCVPKAGNLKHLGYVDALQFYKDLTTSE